MQDPNADTEWNDVLRSKGILPPKQEKEITEDDIVGMLEQSIADKSREKTFDEMNADELDEMEDEIDEEEERLFEEYRRKRILEMQASQAKARFGDVREISRQDYVDEVNKAGEGVWVVLHIYKDGIPLCSLINQHLTNLARKFPATKFLRSVSTVCIPNYPDKNLPTIFVYFQDKMMKQWIGPLEFGGTKLSQDELEWKLGQSGAIQTEIKECPRQGVKDMMGVAVQNSAIDNDDSDNDW
ncbi:unnamed protein product [Owenia fusiformis]|uniref:Phosducin domain-containing protein n=1 Tax=Owenia fusiformis TaxID=6347 RepID=A0A8J1TR36_OWEFU|nr:unnamed protein product [Owenia fusiformis]